MSGGLSRVNAGHEPPFGAPLLNRILLNFFSPLESCCSSDDGDDDGGGGDDGDEDDDEALPSASLHPLRGEGG